MAELSGDKVESDREQESALVTELVEGGTELTGALAGAAIGLLGGPPGAFGGAAAGVVITRALKRVGADLRRRVLGPREEVRVGAAVAFATVFIDQALRAGRVARQDGFFEAKGGERPAADELLEGVLLKARDSYQEKKVPLLANLYASIVFHEEISVAHAGHLLELASRLTYRQLVSMAVALENDRAELRQSDYRGDPEAVQRLGVDGQGLITEIYDLYQQGLISGGGEAWISVTDVNPGVMRPQGSGMVLATAMGLPNAVSEGDRAAVRALLR